MHSALIYLLLSPLMLFFSFTSVAQQKQEVLLLTYHLKAPYIVDLGEQKGLYFDLANYMNQHSESYFFKTEFMPRKRINAILQRPFPHVVIGVQPVWFKQFADKVSFTPAILQEDDVFISLKTNPVTNDDLESLKGKTFIGVQGYRYIMLEEAEQQGILTRVDTLQEDNVLDMLRLGRGDFTITSLSTLRYKFSHGEDENTYFIAKLPHEHVKRRLMYSTSDKKLGKELSLIVAIMQKDAAWFEVMNQYNLDKSFIPAN
ncbi:transporter substrate-binding domain-containing protein [Rheinheimera baltica]|uniref:transporter substrate-binding domain-containing protein n=1 Tax=Rheinheimera baltica TaxID=67576 RepID=UPI00273D1395|nr:transporter substrate-binding domain-containing protein [Rheinheimera baltica]MDP5150793.1 transporter substrate-binding domain-containing protein [Rheinheimera baltica]